MPSALSREDRIHELWPLLGFRLRRRWRRLTEDDVAFPYGCTAYLARVLQDRYGIDHHEALLQVLEFEIGLGASQDP